MKHLSIFAFCLFIFSLGRSQVQNFPLSDNWLFSESGKNTWKPAIVPGNVHRDLLQNNMITDPTIGENYKTSQWVEKKDWEYKNTFSYPDLSHFQNTELVFEGLDTYADVYLNDSLILRTENMFREYIVQVKKYLKEENTLRIIFHNPIEFTKNRVAAAGIRYPADNDASSPFTRKSAVQYGWDFTQRLLTCGIWRKIYLSGWNDFIIRDLHAVQKKITKTEAEMEAVVEVESTVADTLQFELVTTGPSEKLVMKKGMNSIVIPYGIAKPKLWWPNGMGDQNLYDLCVQVQSRKHASYKQIKYGIRTIEVEQKTDYYGQTFSFKVNGIDVYAKGTNYVPPSILKKNITDEELFRTIKNCNMNMIRVWGGGVYESDEFYSLADKNGIMIWQDFMFSGTMYPGDTTFINNVSKEIAYNVKRLRIHPSLALWCGNNEIDVAWKHWDWQKKYKYSAADSLKLITDYNKLFNELIPKKINELDKDVFYFSSSPISNWDKKDDMYYGDNHYWGVWHGEEPVSSYQTHVPRFASEFGMESFPELSSLKKFSSAKDWIITSPVLKAHQFSAKGNGLITKYINENYFPAKNFSSFIYLSQLVQAEALKTAIESQRRSKPFCMGSLYWQMNDCWPAASWSTIDYYGKWKAAQYFIRKSFAPVLVSACEKNKKIIVSIVNDSPNIQSGSLIIKIMKFDGTIVFNETQQTTFNTEIKRTLGFDSLFTLAGVDLKKDFLIYTQLVSEGKEVSSNIFYFLSAKDLSLPKPVITSEFVKDNIKITLKLKTNVLAKNVFVSIEGAEMLNDISDNYFDLLPGEEKILFFSSEKSVEELKKALSIKTVRDTY